MPLAKIRILYIEDQADMLYGVSYSLTRQGFEVITAIDCKTGIAVGSVTHFDVMICDIGLPDGAGWQILQTLRKNKSFPAIALMDFGFESDRARLEEEGFDLSLGKPYEATDLVLAINKLFEESKLKIEPPKLDPRLAVKLP